MIFAQKSAAIAILSAMASCAWSAPEFQDASCSVTSSGKTIDVQDCQAMYASETGSETEEISIQRKSKKTITDSVSMISVFEFEKGKAMVTGLTTDGINSRWGVAEKKNGCWEGSDFKVCVSPKDADKGSTAQTVSDDELMTFGFLVSKITTTGTYNIDSTKFDTPEGQKSMLNFAVRINYIDGDGKEPKARRCEEDECEYGDTFVRGKHVLEQLNSFFGTVPASLPVTRDGEYYFTGDGYLFNAADGIEPYAKATSGTVMPDGTREIKGNLLTDEPNDAGEFETRKVGTFTAVFKPKGEWWSIVSVKSALD